MGAVIPPVLAYNPKQPVPCELARGWAMTPIPHNGNAHRINYKGMIAQDMAVVNRKIAIYSIACGGKTQNIVGLWLGWACYNRNRLVDWAEICSFCNINRDWVGEFLHYYKFIVMPLPE